MISTAPVNVRIMDVDKFIKDSYCLPVSSHQVYEASSTRLHPEGLYSEEIFGEIGTPIRLTRFGYIDLRTTVFHPTIFTTLVELRSLYGEIMSGKTYAKMDESIDDFVVCTKDDPEAGTGYQFFMENFKRIKFKPTNSEKRNIKIRILQRYENLLTITKCLVLPAGIRDIEESDDGRVTSEEVNGVYQSVLSLSMAIPKELPTHPIFDSIRYKLQLKIVEVIDYLSSFFNGKRGFGQGKYMARKIAYGTRNVFTSAILEGSSPDDPRYLKHDETYVPLFQALKMFQPIIQYYLRVLFFNPIFAGNNTQVPVIDKTTGNLVYIEVSDIERNKYMTDDGLESYINQFINKDTRFNPVTIKDVHNNSYYIAMVYDDNNDIYLYRDKRDLELLHANRIQRNEEHVDHLSELDALGLSNNDYVILGSAAAIAHGLNRKNDDIDLFITPEAFKKIEKKLTPVQKAGTTMYKDASGKLDINFSTDVFKDNLGKLFAESEIIGEHRYLTLSGLYDFYKWLFETYKQEKHRLTLYWLEQLISSTKIDDKKIHPVSIYEMMYITAYGVLQYADRQKNMTNTRYPVIHVESIYPSKVHIVTTSPSRLVNMKLFFDDTREMMLPHYPQVEAPSLDALSVHPGWLANLVADFDGDMGNGTGIITENANKEIEQYMASPGSIVSPRGTLITGVHGDTLIPWTLFNMSRDRIQKPMDLSRFRPSVDRVVGMKEFINTMPVNQVVVVGSSFLAMLGLTKNGDIDCIATDRIFEILGTTDSFEYDHKKNEYHSPDRLISVFPQFNGYTFDDLISTAVRMNGVLFAHPRIQYEFYKQRNAPKDAERIRIYEKYLKNEIK